MGKKKCWFTCVKKSEKQRSRKWKWLLHWLRFRHYDEVSQKTLNEATEEQRKHALAASVAAAAAAKAAVASANAAAEIVRLTSVPYEIQMEKQFFAAVEIQSAYRGHLARKALSALKGLVRLQAVVRGELVRRRVVKTLASMSLFLSKSQTQVQRKRVPTHLDYFNQGERRYELSQNERIKSEGRYNSHRSWDLSSVSKEGMEALNLQKQEAVAKRERMKQYSFSHRERRNGHSLEEPMSHRENRKSSRFDQLIELEALQYQEKDKLIKHFSHSNTIAAKASQLPVAQPRPRTSCRQEKMELFDSPFSQPRRSFFHAKEKSSMEDEEDRSLPNSPAFPTYMAATESARAKCRSLSTPKQRLRLCETYWGEHSPYKLGISSWSSFNGDVRKSCERSNISQNFSFNRN